MIFRDARVSGHVSRFPRAPAVCIWIIADCHLIVAPNFEAGFVPQDAPAWQRNAPIPKNRCIYACQIVRMCAQRERSTAPISRAIGYPGVRACSCARPEVTARRRDNDNQADATRTRRALN